MHTKSTDARGMDARSAGTHADDRHTDARRVGKRRPDPHEQRVVDLLVGAFARAGGAGVSRAQIADAVGKSPRSLASYVELSGPNISCPAPVLLRLIQNGAAILGDEAHAWLVTQILRPAGLGAHDLAGEGEACGDLALASLDAIGRMGAFGDSVHDALDDGRVSRDEAKRCVGDLDLLLAKLHGARSKLERVLSGGE